MADPVKVYRIANWAELYETNETRKLMALRWVPQPNKHDGLGYRRMAAQREKCELFSAWNLIVQVASKGRPEQRGWLARDGRPLTEEDLALITNFPEAIFAKAFPFFSGPQIGWLIAEDIAAMPATVAGNGIRPVVPPESPAPPAGSPASSPSCPGDSAAEVNGRNEMNGSAGATTTPPREMETDDQWLTRIQSDYPGIDVRAEAEKALKKHGPFEREWFESKWLRRCKAQYGKEKRKAGKLKEPVGWKTWWTMKHPNVRLPETFESMPPADQAAAWIELAGKGEKVA